MFETKERNQSLLLQAVMWRSHYRLTIVWLAHRAAINRKLPCATCLQRLSHTGSLSKAFPQCCFLTSNEWLHSTDYAYFLKLPSKKKQKQEAIWSLHVLTYLRSALPTHCKTGATIVYRCSICMFKACMVQRSSCSSTTPFTSTNLSKKVYCVTNAGLSHQFSSQWLKVKGE